MTDRAYFLYHSIGIYPGKAALMQEALGAFAESWGCDDDGQWQRALAARREFIDLWRAIIGAPEGSLTTSENVTTALHSLMGSLPSERLCGKRVLVTEDCFPSLHFLLSGLAERLNFTLHTVPLRAGEAWVREEDMIAAWGPDVGLALLTFVTSTASYASDLCPLMAHARRMGSLVALDLTQGVGILPFSLRDQGPDVVVSTSLKWLCGTPGAGVLYVNPGLMEDCQPELRGWFSQPDPFSWDLGSFDYAPDMRRFDHGTPSCLAAAGSVPSLRWHAAEDQARLLEHTRTLGRMIVDGASDLGLSLVSPSDERRRGGSVMLRLGSGIEPGKLVAVLREEGIYLDARGRTLRLSPGAITEASHVTQLFDALHRHRAT